MDSAISSESINSNRTVSKSLVDVISHEATVNLDAQQRLTDLNNGPQGPLSAIGQAISEAFKRTPLGVFAQRAKHWRGQRREYRRKAALKQKIADTTSEQIRPNNYRFSTSWWKTRPCLCRNYVTG
jgi:hypothetical protein